MKGTGETGDEFFESPILNSPYEEPGRYWELDEDDVWIPKKMTDKAKAFQEKYGNIDTDQRHSQFG